MNKIEQWLNAIINEDGHRMSAGSLRTIEMLRTEFKRLQLLQQNQCTTQLPPITDAEYKEVMKSLYPANNSKKFKR